MHYIKDTKVACVTKKTVIIIDNDNFHLLYEVDDTGTCK